MLDLIVIGGAAAACTAAIYSARAKLNFKMITENLGGEVSLAGQVGNWPGVPEIKGFELAQKFIAHVKSYDISIGEGWTVYDIIQKDGYFIIHTKNIAAEEKTYEAKAVIIATGIHPRRLNIAGEKELFHKGTTYCTVCDGPLFKDKITATVGAGNSALESAIMMSRLAKKVYLVTKYENTPEKNGGFPKGEKALVDNVKSTENIEIIYGATTNAIVGKTTVEALKYIDKNGEEKSLAVNGIMIHVGMEPNSDFINFVKKDNAGQIIVDNKNCTNVPGIFAAGDVTNLPYKQIVIATGEGAIAALSVIEYLSRLKK